MAACKKFRGTRRGGQGVEVPGAFPRLKVLHEADSAKDARLGMRRRICEGDAKTAVQKEGTLMSIFVFSCMARNRLKSSTGCVRKGKKMAE